MTEQKQRIIVESKMDIGRIKLGATKRLSRKPLSGVLLEGFFYAGTFEEFIGWEGWHSYNYGEFAPAAPNFSDNLCRQRVDEKPKAMHVRTINPRLPAPFFYDNPSQKRVARCTNIPHTGALPTVKGVGQRLRKGFQETGNGTAKLRIVTRTEAGANPLCRGRHLLRLARPSKLKKLSFVLLESLSSAAEIRHSARNTRL